MSEEQKKNRMYSISTKEKILRICNHETGETEEQFLTRFTSSPLTPPFAKKPKEPENTLKKTSRR